jgi:hypothetical protein
MFLASVYKSLRSLWSIIDNTGLLGFRNKSILAGDLNVKHPVWNSKVSNPSGLKLLELFVRSNFEISAPKCCTHYTSDGTGDVPDVVVHQNARLSEVIVTDTWPEITYQQCLAFWTLLERGKLPIQFES